MNRRSVQWVRLALLLGFLLFPSLTFAQSSPNWPVGYQPSKEEWDLVFATKQDYGTSNASFIDLVASGVVSGAGFTNLFASPPPIGNVVPNTGAFTTEHLQVEAGASYIDLKPFLKTAPFVASTAQLFSQYSTSASGGTPGQVVSNGTFYTSISGAPNAYLWSVLGVVDFAGTGGTGQHVGVYAQGVRRVKVAGGAASNPQIWGSVSAIVDMSNSPSSQTNSLLAHEVDLSTNGADDAHNRSGISLILSKFNAGGAAPVAETGIGVSADALTSSFNSILRLWTPYNVAAIDLRSAQGNSGFTLWFGDAANSIAWNSLATATTNWDPTAMSTGAVVFSGKLQVNGSFFTPGSVTAGAGLSVVGNAGFSGGPVTIDGSGNLRMTAQTNGVAAQTATITNSPNPGNPGFWVPILVNGVTYHFPVWGP